MQEELETLRLMERMESQCHLLEICKALDANGSGEISREELFAGYNSNEDFREALDSMDVTDEDLEVLWTVLDTDKSGTVTYHEFVASCHKLRSSDTHFILAHVKYYITVIKNKL